MSIAMIEKNPRDVLGQIKEDESMMWIAFTPEPGGHVVDKEVHHKPVETSEESEDAKAITTFKKDRLNAVAALIAIAGATASIISDTIHLLCPQSQPVPEVIQTNIHMQDNAQLILSKDGLMLREQVDDTVLLDQVAKIHSQLAELQEGLRAKDEAGDDPGEPSEVAIDYGNQVCVGPAYRAEVVDPFEFHSRVNEYGFFRGFQGFPAPAQEEAPESRVPLDPPRPERSKGDAQVQCFAEPKFGIG